MESTNRHLHRTGCRHYLPASEGCAKKSGWNGWLHFSVLCDGKCERMRRFDKKQITKKMNMTREQIEKVAEDAAIKMIIRSDIGPAEQSVELFKQGARWRINSVWHPGVEATKEKPALIEYPHVDGDVGYLVVQDVREFADIITRFAYLDDLLPERKEETK